MEAGMEVTYLESPIDAMFLIHKALSTEARQVEEMVRRFQEGDSLQAIRMAFNLWAAALIFHAEREDQYMTAPMPDFPPARDNEAEHVDLGKMLDNLEGFLAQDNKRGLSVRVKSALLALHEEQHNELIERLQDVMEVLNDEIGKSRIVARTQRHLYQRVVALRVSQDDHLECEEQFVLPEIRQRFDEEEQLEMMRRLLVDEEAEDPNWVLEWISPALTPAEQQVLTNLAARFNAVGVAGD